MVKMLHEQDFPPEQIRLIAGKQQGHDTPDLTATAEQFYELLKSQLADQGEMR